MKLADVHPGSVVCLKNGDVVVAAVGPGRGRRYVMQASGIMLDASAIQHVKILDVAWSEKATAILLRAGAQETMPDDGE